MASKSLGTLTLDLIAKVGGFEAGMDKAARTASRRSREIAKEAERAAQRTKAAFSGIAKLAVAGLGALGVGNLFGAVIENTKAMEREQAQLAAVLKSTGEAAGFNRDQLNDMAAGLARASTLSAGEINKAQTALLAFTSVVGDEFVRAQQAAADMAARTGMSVVQAAETIGRALDVPSKGMAALSRQGFRFSDEQKALIKRLEETGRAAEAQGIILNALEESYGGAALAARNTFGGALDGLRNTISGLLTGQEGGLEGARLAIEALNTELSKPETAAAFSALVAAIVNGASNVTKALAAIPWEHAADAATLLSIAIGARLGGSIITTAANMQLGAAAAVRYQTALATTAGGSRVAAAAVTALTVAVRGASAAMALLGGPVGLVIAAAGALAYYVTKSGDAKESTQDLHNEVDYLNASFEGFTKNQAAAALLDLQEQLNNTTLRSIDAGDSVRHFQSLLEQYPDDSRAQSWNESLIRAKSEFDGVAKEVESLTLRIRELNAIIEGSDVSVVSEEASKAYEDIAARINEQILLHGLNTDAARLEARINAGLVEGLKEGEAEKLIALQKTRDAQIATTQAQQKAFQASKAANEQAAAAIKRAAEAINSELTALERAAKVWGMTADEVRIYDLRVKGASESQIKHAQALLDTVAGLEQQKKAQEDYKGLVSSLQTDEEKRLETLRAQLAVLDAMSNLDTGERSKQTGRAIDAAFSDAPGFSGIDASIGGAASEFMKLNDAQKELENWYSSQLELLGSFREARSDLNAEWDEKELELKRQHEDALAALEQNRQLVALNAAETTFASLADLAKTFAGEQSGIYRAMFVAEKAAALARSAIAIQGGIALAADNPFPMNIGAMATVAAATAGIVGNIAAIGMAHDGIDSIPQTGTWLLEKGERVTTAGTSAKLDATLSRIQAEMNEPGAGRTYGGGVTVNQTINTTGRIDRRTATQMSTDTARQQRIAQARFGK